MKTIKMCKFPKRGGVELLFLFILTVSIVFLQINFEGYRALQAYFLLVFPISMLGTVLIMKLYLKGIMDFVKKERHGWLVFLGILVAQFIAFLPMLTQPYLFMDELWMFQGTGKPDILSFLPLGRPLAFFVDALYKDIFWTNSNLARFFSALIAMFFTSLLFFWIYKCSKNMSFTFLLTVFTCVTSSMMDMVSFLAGCPMLYGLLFSSVSVYSFQEATNAFYNNQKGISCFWIAISFFTLVFGFNCYAISTPIVFFLLGIYVFTNKCSKKVALHLTSYAGIFIAAALIYYVSIYFFSARYNIVGQIATRGVLTLSPPFILDKLKWFAAVVLPQGIYRLFDAFSFGKITIRNNLFWETGIVNDMGSILCVLFFAFLVFGFAFLWRKGQIKGISIVLEIMLCVASFYPFLVLPESNYMSYYAFPNFCMCCFFFVVIADKCYTHVAQKIKSFFKIQRGLIIVFLLFISIEFNVYSNIAWAQYNIIPFTVAKTEILNQFAILQNTRKIYVIGAAAPVQLDSFSIQTIQQVLYDLGENANDYEITCTLNDSYSKGVAEEIFLNIYNSATVIEKTVLDDCYTADLYYRIYWANEDKITPENAQVLKNLFLRTGIIPEKDSAVFVDLRAVNLWRHL